jgi:hypothetical protein
VRQGLGWRRWSIAGLVGKSCAFERVRCLQYIMGKSRIVDVVGNSHVPNVHGLFSRNITGNFLSSHVPAKAHRSAWKAPVSTIVSIRISISYLWSGLGYPF